MNAYPLGSRILQGLGALDAFFAASEPKDYYERAVRGLVRWRAKPKPQ